ncbi:retron St85 family RNA-directed DNA polymerase [Dysgonomonas sp. ZJ279]|uniref:retron St85 family RNA-directed DNA polymerase n=1 Tax=Dysgonomonas sp. ZJ279 TaxID=2709796 RepID=UPI0013EC07B5|nr:retron St85 family RNA-directed DNA polymerase [Dysgonomonas sp. ZJ279]
MAKDLIKEWYDFFTVKGIEPQLRDIYIDYISLLSENNVPIIFEFNHLALLLGRKQHYLASVVNSPENHYREFKLPKRKGGYREISAPYPALMEMQYWIYQNILKSIRIHSSAHGFINSKSIITNAKIHTGQTELLKLDLKDFFPSISLNRIISVFKNVGYPNQIAFYLAKICTYEECLPQGAPTSPCLSNIIAKNLDKRLMKLAKSLNLRYTRYADDLTFSGNKIPAKVIEYISTIIVDEGFVINQDKTRLYKNKGQRIVTGISVLEKELKLPREYKRVLRQELFFIEKYGLKSHLAKKKQRKANYIFSLIGKLNFWLSIEPENQFALKNIEKLKLILN